MKSISTVEESRDGSIRVNGETSQQWVGKNTERGMAENEGE